VPGDLSATDWVVTVLVSRTFALKFARPAALKNQCEMESGAASGEDWGTKAVSDLTGTELEWSTVTQPTRKIKKHTCAFCGATYQRGPNVVRTHLDTRLKHRNVSASASARSAFLIVL
jgi:hypothetical protein